MQIRSSKLSYLALNVAAWFILLIVGVGMLAAARELGRALQRRGEASSFAALAKARAAQEDWRGAGQAVEQAIQSYPTIAPHIVDSMGTHLLTMPETLQKLDQGIVQLAKADARGGALLALARLRILQARTNEGQSLLERAAELGETEAWLPLGQIRLNQGDFEKAQTSFEKYWSAPENPREHYVDMLSPRPGSAPEMVLSAALHFFRVGLWSEAFETAQQLDPDTVPEAAFFAAVQKDVEGDARTALKLYESMAERLPEHVLTRRRLAFLSKGESTD